MILSKPVTRADVTEALLRIADVADPDDVNCVRAELSRLWRLAEAEADDDLLYSRFPNEIQTNGAYQGSTWYSRSWKR